MTDSTVAPPIYPPAALDPGSTPLARARASARGTWRFLRRNVLTLLGVVVIAGWVFVSVAAPLIAPYDPLKQNLRERLQPPSAQHWMGTDELGRDILSRVMYGGRVSLPIGLAIVLASTVIGTILGSIAGYAGGRWDMTLMRATDLVMAFPPIILAMAVAAALGPGLVNAAIAIIVVYWPNYSRIVRGLVLSVKNHDYVAASHAVGAPHSRILFRGVLPNVMGPAIVLATLDLGKAVLTFAGLSFLGLGAVPPSPEWGKMVADGINSFDSWWVAAFPGLAILTAVMAFNFVGDGLRDALDPRLRRSR